MAIGICILGILAACTVTKDGLTDTYTSGVIAIAVMKVFPTYRPKEIDVFEGVYPLAGIVPRYTTEVEAINLLLKTVWSGHCNVGH